MSNAEGRNDPGWNAWEQMSNADLEELLFLDFFVSDSEESGMGKLYQAAQALAERKKRTHFDVSRSWERFWEKYRALAGAEDGSMPSSDAASGRRHSLCKRQLCTALAAAALAVLLLSVSAAAAAKGAWSGILTWWTDESMTITPGQIIRAEQDEITFPEGPGDYTDIQEALDDYGFFRQVVPRWLPEGFAADDVIVDADTSPDMLVFMTNYVRDEDWIIFGVNIYLTRPDGADGHYADFQKDEGEPVSYESGGVTHMLATNAGRSVAVWTNGPAECYISGDITLEELKQVIDSIYEK